MIPYEHPESRERRLREGAESKAKNNRQPSVQEVSRRLQAAGYELRRTQGLLERSHIAHRKSQELAEELHAELETVDKAKDELTTERDSLVTANRSLKTLHQVQEEIINELRAKLVRAENPSAVKALAEERESLTKTRESLTKAREALTEECDQLRAQLAQARKELKRAREQREEARGQAADTEAGLVATITDGGVSMHGHLAEGSTYEQRAAVLNRAVNLLVFTPTPE